MGSTITISKRPYHINVSIMSILRLYHEAQPSLGNIKHHGSKAITKGYIIMGSTNINKHIIGVIKGSPSSMQGTIKYVGHLHMQSPSVDHHQGHHRTIII